MVTISTNYTLKWIFIEHPNYAITTCKKIINVKKSIIIKKTVNGGSIGWWIGGKFIIHSKINSMVKLISKHKCPF